MSHVRFDRRILLTIVLTAEFQTVVLTAKTTVLTAERLVFTAETIVSGLELACNLKNKKQAKTN